MRSKRLTALLKEVRMSNSLLTKVISSPHLFTHLSIKEQELVMRQAEGSDLLATLGLLFKSLGVTENLKPTFPHSKYEAAINVARAHSNFIQWEVSTLQEIFKNDNKPLILLKGAAYSIAGLPNGLGRLYSDIDLLVHKAELNESELLLKRALWVDKSKDAYDQMYYRKWMHEIPPLTHVKRKSVLDVHHAILPETCKHRPAPHKLFDAVVPVANMENVFVLSPVDMVLHSMTHLFYEGEFNHGLRDLFDLDMLIKHFSAKDAKFWPKLIARGQELNLQRPLYYGIRYTKRILNTPVPDEIETLSMDSQPRLIFLMDRLFDKALMPNHPSCNNGLSGIAKWLLYVRSHYLRMPIRLLIPHLFRKAWKTHFSNQTAA